MDLREHLLEIYQRRGELTPEIVVEEARPETSPLHAMVFDRSPEEAAEAWYRHRAHELIQRVRVKYVSPDTEEDPASLRFFHAVRSERGIVYKPLDEIASSPFLSEMLLRDAEREWRQLFSRYGHLSSFLNTVKADVEAA